MTHQSERGPRTQGCLSTALGSYHASRTQSPLANFEEFCDHLTQLIGQAVTQLLHRARRLVFCSPVKYCNIMYAGVGYCDLHVGFDKQHCCVSTPDTPVGFDKQHCTTVF